METGTKREWFLVGCCCLFLGLFCWSWNSGERKVERICAAIEEMEDDRGSVIPETRAIENIVWVEAAEWDRRNGR